MKQRAIPLWFVLILLSRIPFLTTGYGADGDAWRVAESALRIWNEGTYEVSRFPGFPAHEFLTAPFVGMGGSTASNLATFVAFLLSLYALRKIIDFWRVPMPDMLLVVFSFLPLVWKTSAVTMDYAWGLAGILTSVWLVLGKRFVLGGILLGLAVGTRITHLAFVLPFFLLIPQGEKKSRITFAVSSIGTAVACYIPVVLSYSWGEITGYFASQMGSEPLWKTIGTFFYRSIYSVGLAGFLGIVVTAVLQRSRIKDLTAHPGFVFSINCIAITLTMFAFLPGEREYLMPMMPFLLIVLFLIGTRRQVAVTSVLLLSFSFVSLDIIKHKTPSPEARFAFVEGLVLKEYSDRMEFGEWKKRLLSMDLPDSSIVMIGRGPIFGLENTSVEPAGELGDLLRQSCYRARNKSEVYYVYSLNHEQLTEMRKRGFKVYYTDNAKLYLEGFVGYRLEDENILELKIPGDESEDGDG